MKSLCVFCGSNTGADPAFLESAQSLGRLMAENNINLVYGGARAGLMGAVADAVLAGGGEVTGVLPRFLADKEVAHAGLTRLILCDSLHQRKMTMFEQSQGFLALPGGFGTLEEIIEVLTWQRLRLHSFPIGFLNVNGFYDSLKGLFTRMSQEGFIRAERNPAPPFFESSEVALAEMIRHSP